MSNIVRIEDRRCYWCGRPPAGHNRLYFAQLVRTSPPDGSPPEDRRVGLHMHCIICLVHSLGPGDSLLFEDTDRAD